MTLITNLFQNIIRINNFVTEANPYNPSVGAYLNRRTIDTFLVVLALFQCLLILWLKDILVAVYKALTSSDGNVEDHRSDSED